ncbi:NAD-dependent epimerase/dehydratase family protein [Rhodovastum atsumiense]|uniref:NAD-dependent epimerase/dehydratase family protein n=1 Tax=Rhodovastum atsumiense TaxID=504468 RepID=A0A5M6IUG1_9PROT|nr:NAD-dependent epimerase/dehydratase family protein [Rhodovastum atsumiense]KAA5611507.1 NAD-dependent epimerase/dehydratase family protein [Rhodovastum atsumiense]CAH2601206.1 NAD-dependent epimerase/dehydratase family protein [Rhodovastum atsumiense]
MKRALIGHTGFVGGTLLAAGGFSHGFNTRDFRDMAGQHFDEIVCAGIPSVKWLANQEPEQDRAAIRALLEVLERTRAGRFVLISTIDVYPDPARPLDEDADLAGLPNQPYGLHRFEVERFVAERFPVHTIIRLPALFGDGLKKNALFDLLNDNMVDRVNPAATLQWYPTRRLPGDLARIAGAGLPVVNLVTEPVAMRDVIARFFRGAPVGPDAEPAPHYALRTKHAALFGGTSPWIMAAPQVLAAMGDFVSRARRR